MNKYIKIALVSLVFVLLIGCSKKQSFVQDDNYHAETDYPYSFHHQGMGLLLTPAENGYYFEHSKLLYYTDAQQLKPVVLDNRPNNGCDSTPTANNCYAYVETVEFPRFLQYYQSKLYSLENVRDVSNIDNPHNKIWILVSRDADGTNRKKVYTFATEPNRLAIHRGFLYYSATNSDKDGNSQTTINRVSLAKSNKQQVLFTSNDPELRIVDLLPYGKQVYWTKFRMNEITFSYNTQRYDIEDGTIGDMWLSEEIRSSKINAIENNRVYYKHSYGESDKRNFIVHSSDLNGRNEKEVDIRNTSETLSNFSQDSRYTYIWPIPAFLSDEDRETMNKLSVYKEGIKLNEVDLNQLHISAQLIVGDDRYLFARNVADKKNTLLFLDKGLLQESKDIQLQTLIEAARN